MLPGSVLQQHPIKLLVQQHKPLLLCICSPWWVGQNFRSFFEDKALPAVAVHLPCHCRDLSPESGPELCRGHACWSLVQAQAWRYKLWL